MDLLRFFTAQHAATHAADVYDGRTRGSDRWLGDLSEAQVRVIPRPGLNSILRLLWHMARTEDVAVNLVVAGRSQVLDEARPGGHHARCRRGRVRPPATSGSTASAATRAAARRHGPGCGALHYGSVNPARGEAAWA